VEAGFNPRAGNLGRVLSEPWHVDAVEIPGLLHRMDLCQSVVCRNADGRTIRLRVEPNERAVRCQEETEAEETEL
jgi:hypothetical protein